MILKHITDRVKPFRRRVDDVLRALLQDGLVFRLVKGTDSGWFGDGAYVLASDTEWLRITRSRKEEFLDIAFVPSPGEKDWVGIAELMVAIGDITFDRAVSGDAVPHDLDFKLAAYRKLRSLIYARLGPNPGHHETLAQVRRLGDDYARQKYGRNTMKA